jgi:MoxR-like ATPase
MVLATQNPIEMEGTYPLPEAQLDRFMLKLQASFPNAQDLATIVDRSTGVTPPEISPAMSAAQLLKTRELIRSVSVATHVRDFAVQVLLATHPQQAHSPPAVQRFVRHGASPRGLLAMMLAAKAFAVFDGRLNVSFEDLRHSAPLALRHRILLNFEGEAEGVLPDTLVDDVLQSVAPSAA